MTLLGDQQSELASNVTFCVPIWRMEARDGTIAAYCEGGIAPIVYDGITYNPSPIQSTRPTTTTGLEADSSELRGVFDSIVTKAHLKSGKWAGAEICREILVSQLDLSLETVRKQKGKAGTIEPLGNSYKISFESQVSPLSQKLGDVTSNSDRVQTIEGLLDDVSSFTHAATVTNVTDRRTFKVDYDAPDDTYLQNGRVAWLTGANAGKSMEIKSGIRTDGNTKTLITLHEEMASTIVVSDTLSVIRGYKLTREDAVDIGNDAILNTQGEFDMQPEGAMVAYPE